MLLISAAPIEDICTQFPAGTYSARSLDFERRHEQFSTDDLYGQGKCKTCPPGYVCHAGATNGYANICPMGARAVGF